jgi:plasmid stabilization system protein ParE
MTSITPKDRRARAQRWRDAVDPLVDLPADSAAWRDSLPPSREQSATAEALRAICDLDLSDLAAAGPPRGYGRD